MRALRVLAPLLLLLAARPATAAEIVQTSSGVAPVAGGFVGFDPTLGTLTGVTLGVTATDHRMANVSGVTGTVSVSWTIDGVMHLTISQLGGSSLA
ncbi:MAG: choice-of-anchor E domain-containing protein, partial [Sphingomicrobium sp.]